MSQPQDDAGLQPGAPEPAYPRQVLLPQEVRPSRSRLPLLLGAVAVAVLLIGGLLTWLLLRDDGESSRAAYCRAMRELTNEGDLPGAVSGGLADAPAAIAKVRDLAPDAVRGEWDDLYSLVQNPPSGDVDIATGLRFVSDLRTIVNDARTGCDLQIDLPL